MMLGKSGSRTEKIHGSHCLLWHENRGKQKKHEETKRQGSTGETEEKTGKHKKTWKTGENSRKHTQKKGNSEKQWKTKGKGKHGEIEENIGKQAGKTEESI